MFIDVAKSMMRLSWVMGIYGLDRAAELVRQPGDWQKTSERLDALSRAAADQMGDEMRRIYRAGDSLQRGVVDSVAKLGEGNWSQPGDTLQAAWKNLDRTLSETRATLDEAPAGAAKKAKAD